MFDLIIMTGNAFQVFLEDDDIFLVFATMRKHLTDKDLAAFETHNPAVDWLARWTTFRGRRSAAASDRRQGFVHI